MKKTTSIEKYEVTIYRIVFALCCVVSPVITYLWKIYYTESHSSILMGWVMSAAFLFCFVHSFISKKFRENLIYPVYGLFLLSTFSALYFAYANQFGLEYTLLFFLTVFGVSVVLDNPLYLFIYYILNAALVAIFLALSPVTYTSKRTLVIIYGLFFIVSNLNARIRHKNQQKLSKSEEEFQLLVSQMRQGVAFHEVIRNEKGDVVNYRFIRVNDSFETMTGLKRENIIGRSVLEILPNTEKYWIEAYGRVATTGESYQYENYSIELDKYFTVSAYSSKRDHFAVIITDITENKKLEMALAKEKNLLETTLISVGDGVISTDNEGRIVFLNRVAECLTGFTQAEARGRPIDEIFHVVSGPSLETCESTAKKVLRSGKILELANHTSLVSKEGIVRAIEDSAAPIIQENGDRIGMVLVFRDFTDKKMKQMEIEYLSFHDQLTGVYNRRYYENAIKKLDSGEKLPLSLIMVDVNGLKLTNDAFGHREGDTLLEKVSRILRKECHKHDIIARIGGDEFVLLLPNTDLEQAKERIKSINNAISAEQSGHIIISVSIGCAMKQYVEEDVSEVFKKAEDEMYRHKLSESTSMRSKTIDLIMNTLYEKNTREMLHSKRVGTICEKIATAMNFGKDTVNQIRIAGLMHDIGKIGIDENILNNSESLNEMERGEIERHSEIGYRILSSVNEFSEIADYVLEHHERWDGKGYPRGLKEEEISIQARIITVADAYEAMTTDRPYRKALSMEEAMDEIRKYSGSQFDAQVVDVLIENVLSQDRV